MVAAGAELAQGGKGKGKGKGKGNPPRKKEGKGYGYKHWWCTICNHDNKSWREECHDCGMPREVCEWKTRDQWAVERYKNSLGGTMEPRAMQAKGNGKKGSHGGEGHKGAGGPQNQEQTPKTPGLQQPEMVAPAKLWKAYELAVEVGGANSVEAISYKAKWEAAMEDARAKISPAEKRKATVANLTKTEKLLDKAHKDLERCRKVVEEHEKGILAAKKQMDEIMHRGLQLEEELYKYQRELAEAGPEKAQPPPIDLARLGLQELTPGAAAQAKGLLEALEVVLRLGKASAQPNGVGDVSREAAAVLAAQNGNGTMEESWNNLREGDEIILAGGGKARVQETAAEGTGNERTGEEETPATVPANGLLPTFLDSGTTAGDEGMEASHGNKNKRSDGRSRSPTEITDRRRKKGRGGKEENSDDDEAKTPFDPIQCTQYSTRLRGKPGQTTFHEMQAATKAGDKTKKPGGNGTGWSRNDSRRLADRRQGGTKTPLGKKEEESEEERKMEPAEGGEETANEGQDWLDEEAELVRRSAGEEPFCG
jgi:hypothetical protein